MVHGRSGFRLAWFENNTRVIGQPVFFKIYREKADYVVLPEDLGVKILSLPGKKIIFNQNIYYGFDALGPNKVNDWPYLDKSVKFIMTVSLQNQRYLQFAFPNARIRRIYYGVDSEKFTYKPINQKKKIITLLAAKAPLDSHFLYQVLSARAGQGLNRLRSYQWCFSGRNSEGQTAKILGETLIFVFPSTCEGFGLMPLEAMLSGAIVVAYKGGAYCEYLSRSNSFLVDSSDKLALIKIAEYIAEKFTSLSGRKELQAISQRGYEAAKRYSLEREEKSVLEFWKEVIG